VYVIIYVVERYPFVISLMALMHCKFVNDDILLVPNKNRKKKKEKAIFRVLPKHVP
jgi:hypothetical protein